MLFIEKNDLEPIAASEIRSKCSVCAERMATWSGPTKTSGTRVPMCAWCVLYAGSAWGHKNRDEILSMGITIRQSALARVRGRPNVRVPELDERHRLPPEDAEKLMLGVAYTSAHLRPRLVGALAPLRGE